MGRCLRTFSRTDRLWFYRTRQILSKLAMEDLIWTRVTSGVIIQLPACPPGSCATRISAMRFPACPSQSGGTVSFFAFPLSKCDNSRRSLSRSWPTFHSRYSNCLRSNASIQPSAPTGFGAPFAAGSIAARPPRPLRDRRRESLHDDGASP